MIQLMECVVEAHVTRMRTITRTNIYRCTSDRMTEVNLRSARSHRPRNLATSISQDSTDSQDNCEHYTYVVNMRRSRLIPTHYPATPESLCIPLTVLCKATVDGKTDRCILEESGAKPSSPFCISTLFCRLNPRQVL